LLTAIEERRWSLEDVIALTDAYWAPKLEAARLAQAAAKRAADDDLFQQALAAEYNH